MAQPLLLPRFQRRLWSFLELAGAGAEFFDLALEVGASTDVLFLQDTVSVDGKGVGDGFHTKQLRDRAVEAAVSVLEPGHVVLRDEVLPFGRIVVETDASRSASA
jgi:hypothetical protein